MPWKDPGGKGPWGSGSGNGEGNNGQSQWGEKRSSPNNGANIDELIDRLQARLRRIMSGGGGHGGPGRRGTKPTSGRSGFIMGFVVLLIIWLATGFYRVNEGEVGVVLRFGEMVEVTSAGLRYHLPMPIESVIVQRVSAITRIDGGTRAEAGKGGDANEQTVILTGDENMVLTSYTILWRVKDVTKFLFTARDPEDTIQVAAESVLREVFGLNTARTALTEGRDPMAQKTQELLQKLMDEYHLGVEIVSVQLQRVEPPAEVIEAFNDVQASIVDADRYRNEAEGYRNDILPRARGDVQRIIKDAEAYREQTVAKAEGEAARFLKVLDAVQRNRSVVLTRKYLETMQTVFGKSDKIILDSKAAKGVTSYLPLNELRKAKKAVESEAKQ